MKIIIAGAGKIGRSVAQILSEEGHDITIIEQDEETILNVSNDLDVICYSGSAANPQVLREAGAESADLLMAATEKDEVNMICGVTARRLGTRHVIARIRDPQYLEQTEFLREVLGLSVIVNPEYECAKDIARALRFPSAVRVDAFSKGSVEIMEYKIPSDSILDGLYLRELMGRAKAKVLIGVVERNGEAIIPNGSFVLRAGDRLSITGATKELRRFFINAGQYKKPVKKVMIMGGSRTSVYLTQMLDDSGMSISIIERSKSRCDELYDLVPSARIIHGDATRSDVLIEEGIRSMDAFVGLTGDDGDNIITSMYAKNCDVSKIITKVDHGHFAEVLRGSGIDSVVTPKELVAQQLARYVRAMDNSAGSSMETLYRLADGKVEALEFKVGEGAKCVGIPLRELKLKKNILISAVIRGSKSIIPDGSTVIEPGDHAVIVTTAGRINQIDAIVEGE